jgi:hypothetical protein
MNAQALQRHVHAACDSRIGILLATLGIERPVALDARVLRQTALPLLASFRRIIPASICRIGCVPE